MLPAFALLFLPILETRKLRPKGFCDLPGITQLNWRSNSEILSLSSLASAPPRPPRAPISFPVQRGDVAFQGTLGNVRRYFWLSQPGVGGQVEVLLASSGWRPSMRLHILERTEGSNKEASGPKQPASAEAQKPGQLGARPQREVPSPASCLGVLGPAAGLASLPRLLQELKRLASVPVAVAKSPLPGLLRDMQGIRRS